MLKDNKISEAGGKCQVGEGFAQCWLCLEASSEQLMARLHVLNGAGLKLLLQGQAGQQLIFSIFRPSA